MSVSEATPLRVRQRRHNAVAAPKLYVVTIDELSGVFDCGVIVGGEEARVSIDAPYCFVADEKDWQFE